MEGAMAVAFIAGAAGIGRRIRALVTGWRDQLRGWWAALFQQQKPNTGSLDTGEVASPLSGTAADTEIEGSSGRAYSNKAIIAELRWRAACQLLQRLGGARIPRQLRKRFEEA